MRFHHLQTLIAASLAVSAYGSIIPDEAPAKGYEVFIPEWELELTPGGEKAFLNGTVQEVFDEIHHMNPLYSKAFGLDLYPTTPPSAKEKRADFSDARVICQNFPAGSVSAGYDVIRYLRAFPGKPINDAGPGTCGRVSCSWGTAIWWCNDDNKLKTLNSFGSIADGADKVWGMCTDRNSHYDKASGQAFHDTNCNVIIRNADC
ncbi:hypothetical protein CORC01_01820 [Colletotrichum orchidophilum]|uniref:Secreted protein n=1 Tax=Colletotrichum orchidophilum TaxID=1209926 RepID=A0A1G4BNN9_9PEZI|nr:uncharacterized protein CORC01_01820 [Colletotrichum orchidophilum]OHF03062.1 hypothetical protein CORC01_01820 [Colletotrichum orchidophilum]